MTDTHPRPDDAGQATPIEPSPRALPFRIITLAELLEATEAQWLVDDTFPRPGLVVLYGAPAVGKTFVALDLALSVAAGIDAFDRPTREGRVLYIAAEGRRGLLDRVRAWQTKAGLDATSLLFDVIAAPVDLLDGDVVDALREHVTAEKPALIVIDTLARCFGDGDENAARDMNAFVDACSDLSASADATVLVVHHSGHDGGRARGSSALNGAADTMVRLAAGRSGDLVLRCDKQKDGERFGSIKLLLERVALDESGDRSSCIVRSPAARTHGLTDAQWRVLLAVADTDGAQAVTQKALQATTGLSKAAVSTALKHLVGIGSVRADKGVNPHVYALTAEGAEIATEHLDSRPISPNESEFTHPPPLKGGESERTTATGGAATGGDR